MRSRTLLVLIVALFSRDVLAQGEQDQAATLHTVAESSGYTRTATSKEVHTLARAIADASQRVVLASLGESGEGMDIPLLLVADPPVDSIDDLKTDDRLLVLLFGNIHAGEVCGKEALLMIAREAGLSDTPPAWLEHVIVAIAPNYNPDGNDRMAPGNRPGQDGPETMGTRANAKGLDLNRDHVKMDAPETRALNRFIRRYDPAVVVDTHTTNGSNHRYTLTHQGPKHPAGDAEVIAYVRDTMLPRIGDAFTEASGYESFVYGNFEARNTKWTTYPAEPRYGTAYRGMRNRIAILSEAYAYAPYRDRVLATKAFCEAILADTNSNKKTIRELLKAADDRTINAAGTGTLALQAEPRAFPDRYTVKGYVEYDDNGERIVPPVDPFEHSVELFNDFVPTLHVKRPHAYVIPAAWNAIAEHLQRHGVRVDELREDVDAPVAVYRLDAFEIASRPFQQRTRIENVTATSLPQSQRLAAGSFIVPMDQPLASLAGYLLEPQATDGLFAWRFFADAIEPGDDFPILRLATDVPLLTTAARTLDEDREPAQPITIDSLYGDRKEYERPSLRGGSPGRIQWIDDDPEHYTLYRDGRLWRVHATTGRAEPAQDDQDAIAARLTAIDTIDARTAASFARNVFATLSHTDAGAIFEHGNDLYHAERDGSNVVRLTATPEDEENAALSPDGRFVSFVRDNNLWVVDVQTQTERAITTQGTDSHRFGKASWVYFEEVFGRNWNASWWSPDSTRLVFMESDDAAVPYFTIVDDRTNGQRLETVRYPKPGDPNPQVWAWIANAHGGSPVKIDLSRYDPGRFLITQVLWTPDGKHLHLAVQDRSQTWLDLLRVNAATGRAEVMMRETTEAWVEPIGQPEFLENGSFIARLARDGWMHLYHFDSRGTLTRRITEGDWDVKRVHLVDEATGWIYIDASKDCYRADNLYRVRIDGSQTERLTHEMGDHSAQVNADGTMFIDAWSSIDTPTRTALRNSRGATIRTLDTNPVHDLDAWTLGRVEAVRVPSAKGVTLEGILIYPPDFDPSKRYPAWFHTYGGPMAPRVSDSWAGGRTWDHMLASLGMVVFIADPYPASAKGPRSAWTAYRNLGVRELEDIKELIAWLKDKPFIDGERIGMNGHSFGGFMTAFAMTHSDLFAAGIAGAPVTDWRLYDSIYTERYMGTPQDNPEGYAATSVVASAENLSGRLLILHGDIDDNVHMQNTTQLIAALHDARKQFDLMIYPGSRHGIRPAHNRYLMVDFIREHVVRDGPIVAAPMRVPSESPPTVEEGGPILGP